MKKRIVILSLGLFVILSLFTSVLNDIFQIAIGEKVDPFIIKILIFIILFFLIHLMLKISPFDELDRFLRKLENKFLAKFKNKK